MSFEHLFRCHFVNGEWIPSTNPSSIPVENPATEAVFAHVPEATREEVDQAVRAAAKAFPLWRDTALNERIRRMEEMLQHFEAMEDEIVRLEVMELGAPVTFARKKHCRYQMERTRAYIRSARSLAMEIPCEAAVATREPIGVVACVTPWNYPLGQVIQKIVPAILMGNTAVLKPSHLTPLTALLLTEAFRSAGFPPGVMNLIQGYGRTVGNALLTHPEVSMVSFTGSTEVGRKVAASAAGALKRMTLELGGKSPAVWLPGTDCEAAARKLFESLLTNAGQTCTALSRLIVPKKELPRVFEALSAALPSFPVGDPQETTTRMGPLVSREQWESVRRYVEIGLSEGATLMHGSLPEHPAQGHFMNPVVFTDVKPSMRIAREEIFGPVLCVLTYDTLEEAVRLANDSPYGLSAAVWGPEEEALRVARRIDAGNVFVNGAARDLTAPFGGYKESGIGREGGWAGLIEFTQLKAIFI